VLKALLGDHDRQVCYVTSSLTDPVLDWNDSRLTVFNVGSGAARTALFSKLRAKVMVMTTPDLETMRLKRSKHQVHYVYVHHAINSMHMAYRPAAFDHFDAILCVGPHHEEEVRQTEAIYGLPPKVLVKHGYGRLDSIIESAPDPVDSVPLPSDAIKVLIAPSWGPNALLENCGDVVIEAVLGAGNEVTVRPHPMTIRNRAPLLNALEDRYRTNEMFRLDRDVVSEESLYESDIMIGDWGGMSLEYAFALGKPVISIDLPRKVNNPDYRQIPCEPLEVTLRTRVGAVVQTGDIAQIPALINKLCDDPVATASQTRELRERYVYNIGRSGSVGAKYIIEAASSPATPS